MNESQRKKAKFRSSKKWKSFKHEISVRQGERDYITGAKLRKYAALHHADLDPDNYQDLSNPHNFYYLNNGCHDVVHYLFTYYKKDSKVLERLQEVLDRMKELNP